MNRNEHEHHGPIKVYLAVGHYELAGIMTNLLRQELKVKVVGYANTLEKALAELGTIKVDVFILDFRMRQTENVGAIHILRHVSPRLKILITTDGGHEDQQIPSLLAHANGFLYKPFDLVKAVISVSDGKAYFDFSAVHKVLSEPSHAENLQLLTAHEFDFLALVKQGLSTADIAKKLDVETKAIYQLRFRIKTKLGLRSARDIRTIALPDRP